MLHSVFVKSISNMADVDTGAGPSEIPEEEGSMKRKLPLLLSVFGCALGVAVGDAAAQAKYNLRWGHYLADSPFIQLEKDFVAAIEKRTNGQVKITITFAQGLGNTTELRTLTAKGAIDM